MGFIELLPNVCQKSLVQGWGIIEYQANNLYRQAALDDDVRGFNLKIPADMLGIF